jgi:hypothetical protein
MFRQNLLLLFLSCAATAVAVATIHDNFRTRAALYGARQAWTEPEPFFLVALVWVGIVSLGFLVPLRAWKLGGLVVVWGAVLLLAERERGLWYVPQARYVVPPSVDFVLVTTKRTKWRAATTLGLLRRANVNASVVWGIDAKEYASAKEMYAKVYGPDEKHAHKLSGNAAGLMLSNVVVWKSAHESEWLVVFEDDAVPLHDFLKKLYGTLTHFSGMDMVWLDTRNAYPYRIAGKLTCCTAAVAYRVERLPLLVDSVREISQPIDLFLADKCNSGALKCGASMLVKEGDLGFGSSFAS